MCASLSTFGRRGEENIAVAVGQVYSRVNGWVGVCVLVCVRACAHTLVCV